MLKRKLIIIIVFFVSLFSINYVYSLDISDNLIGKIKYIDPGHGSADPGVVYENIEEAAINLTVSKKIKENLEKLGAGVYITREGDYDLSSTTINKKKSDLYNRINLI